MLDPGWQMANFRDLSKLNIDLSDRAAGDRLRHDEAIKEAIRKDPSEILNEIDIFKTNKESGDKYKVTIQLVEEFKLSYEENSKKGQNTKVGQKKNVAKGQVIGQVGSDKSARGITPGTLAGRERGKLTFDLAPEDLGFVLDFVSRDLDLPFLDPNKSRDVTVKRQSKWQGLRERGAEPRFDIEASFTEKLRRKKAVERRGEKKEDFPFIQNDLRYHGMKIKNEEQANAVLIFIADVSGSMDKTKRYFQKAFSYALYCLVRAKYQNAQTVFIAHDTDATEVNSEVFFKLSSDGGTIISSGPKKAAEIIKSRFPPEAWNIYVIHCSDGDNDSSDNDNTVASYKEISGICKLVGFIEIRPGITNFSATSQKLIEEVKIENFRVLLINKKSEVSKRFREFLALDPDLLKVMEEEKNAN
jgi:uncharacterized sporulation protein YeaH/YhbH (DUF444 family)